MSLIQSGHMIEQISAAVANPALRNVVLPETVEAGSFQLDTQSLDGNDDLFAEAWRPIENQIPRAGILGECLSQLLPALRTVRMLGDVAMQDSSLIMRNDEEAVQYVKRQRRNREGIHRSDSRTMITHKDSPSFRRLRILWRSPHPAQSGSFGNFEAKHRQLSVDARSTPSWVLGNHAKDELTQFCTDSLTAWASSMPSRNRLLLNEN